MKKRNKFVQRIDFSFKVNPVVAILGPRQCGKTTLARIYIKQKGKKRKVHYFDLEDPEDISLLENPKLALSPLNGLIIIDEIQKISEIFPLIRVLVDMPNNQKQFLILGSASRDLIHQSSETLAGRISYIELTPFSFHEVEDMKKLWIRGGFPRAYLAESLTKSVEWRKEYISAFLERDIPNLGFNIPAQSLRRFWMMMTAYHGNIFNSSEIGRSLGLSGPTMRRYLDLLIGTFMVRQLQPWFENITKRQIKSPKIYFRDSGIFHTLLGINEEKEITHHPKLGASWEGFALESVIRAYRIPQEECFFWAIHQQFEIDLMIFLKGKKVGFEFKWSDAPKLTKSIVSAFDILKLHKCFIIYPGNKSYQLTENIFVFGLEKYLNKLKNESTFFLI